MFESGKWIVAPYKEKKLYDSYIISIDNTDSIIELNTTAHTILTIIEKLADYPFCTDDVISKMKAVFNLSSANNDELKTDVQDILCFFVNCKLIYQEEQ